MLEKVLPLLNRLIPSSLAKKGLEKKIPQLNNFFQSAAAAGYGLDSALDFLREQYEPQDSELRPDEQAANARVQQGAAIPQAIESVGKMGLTAGIAGAIPSVIGNLFQKEEGEVPPQQAQPPELPREVQQEKVIQKANQRREQSPLSREGLQEQFQQRGKGNLISQYSPELATMIDQEIQSGLMPIDAGLSAARSNPNFNSVISKMERELRMPFAKILEQVYGFSEKLPQGQQQGQGKADLLDTMKQITQSLQNLRGK